MSARSYLSIGDVLTLLRQEFPDVTISKIRFLESQGLVNPERTPSGYRKFYEHDVERLRWVLRQQREHFLPLKVIKDRLDDDPIGSPVSASARRMTAGAVAADDASPDGQNHAKEGEESAPPVLVGQRAAAEAGRRSTLPGIESTRGAAAIGKPTAPTAPSGPPPTAPTGPPPTAVVAGPGPAVLPHPLAADAVPGREADDRSGPVTVRPDPHAATGDAPVGSMARRSRSSTGDDEPASSRRGKPTPPSAGTPGTSGDTRPAANGAIEPPRSSSKPAASAPGGGGRPSLSVDELSSACGLEVGVLRELEGFGLLTPTNVAGVESFGEDALAVAQLAAQFARFGIEPRHLRLYKNAADREAGFVEQIVLPLVRQRNPDARARARETADELALLGQQLRSSLLRRALGDLLEG
ncbi:MAG: MerR family transcriptional regulator [Acidimicrobiales bacterium]